MVGVNRLAGRCSNDLQTSSQSGVTCPATEQLPCTSWGMTCGFLPPALTRRTGCAGEPCASCQQARRLPSPAGRRNQGRPAAAAAPVHERTGAREKRSPIYNVEGYAVPSLNSKPRHGRSQPRPSAPRRGASHMPPSRDHLAFEDRRRDLESEAAWLAKVSDAFAASARATALNGPSEVPACRRRLTASGRVPHLRPLSTARRQPIRPQANRPHDSLLRSSLRCRCQCDIPGKLTVGIQ